MKHAIVFVVFMLSQGHADAYETDVHLGLTAVLARLAGFSPGDALAIANADQALDRDQPIVDGKRHDAVHVVIDEIIFESDNSSRTLASKRVQFDHFPGTTELPLEPRQRVVVSGSANNLMTPRLQALSKVKSKDQKWLEMVGYTLHPYQDSWSHAGVPDIPVSPVLQFRDQYSWGHPDLRGGWSHHRADLTCADEKSSVAMAKATFVQLSGLCDSVTGRACASSGWTEELEKSVIEFVRLDTQSKKRLWLSKKYKAIGLPDIRETLSDISLPLEAYKTERSGFVTACSQITKKSSAITLPNSNQARVQVPRVKRSLSYVVRVADEYRCEKDESLHSVAKDFLYWWLTESLYLKREEFLGTENKHRDRKFAKYIDSDNLQIQMQQWVGAEKVEYAVLWPAVFLRMWLVRDHGIIEALGHADPTSPAYETLRDFLFDTDKQGGETRFSSDGGTRYEVNRSFEDRLENKRDL